MENITHILEELRNTSSTNEKKAILERNKDNEVLKKVLLYTYDPFRKYGISEKILNELINEVTEVDFPTTKDLYEFLDILATSNINNELKRNICASIKYANPKFQNDLKGVFLKDLKIGANTALINKVWKNLIPKFDVQLARKFSDVKLNDKETIYITEKLDGIRCIMIKTGKKINFYTRQGKEILGLKEVENEIFSCFEPNENIVLDGELLALNPDGLDSGDLYRATTKIVNSKSDNKTGIIYNVFDILRTEEFYEGKSEKTYKHRRNLLDTINAKCKVEHIKIIPLLYSGDDHSKIHEFLSLVESQGKEGLMINRDVCYQCKRNNGLLKVKTMQTVDLRVIGFEEGQGNFVDTLGALIVDYKGNQVKVGSGFSELERREIWNNKEIPTNSILGKIIEVQYFEESTNENGTKSLRFPVFKHIRHDKTEPSYN